MGLPHWHQDDTFVFATARERIQNALKAPDQSNNSLNGRTPTIDEQKTAVKDIPLTTFTPVTEGLFLRWAHECSFVKLLKTVNKIDNNRGSD